MSTVHSVSDITNILLSIIQKNRHFKMSGGMEKFCLYAQIPKFRVAASSLKMQSDLGLAQQLVDGKAIPQAAFTDAVHVAVAARHLVPYLATWNFAHLANPRTLPKIEQICHDAGYQPPRIDSPEGILEELSCVIIP